MDWTAFALKILVFLVSLSFHEAAHAWTAWKLGDYTGKGLGRVSLNPVRHIDPIGTVLLPLALWFTTNGSTVFGYAKPVPYNPYVLKNPSLGSVAIAGAGPASNLVLAAVAAAVWGLATRGGPLTGTLGADLMQSFVVVNIGLALFNLIPIPPLDGGTIVLGLLGRRAQAAVARVESFAFLVLILLWSTGALGRVLDPAFRALYQAALAVTRATHG